MSSRRYANWPLSESEEESGVTFRRTALGDSGRKEMVQAVFDYHGRAAEELSFLRGSLIEVMSKDAAISGDEGWWTGRCEGKLGVFPANYVQSDIRAALAASLNYGGGARELPKIAYDQLHFAEDGGSQLLGSGGFGKVFRARYQGHLVAVKVPNLDADPEKTEEAVRDEAQLFQLLSHDNIVSLVGVCLEPRHLALILEFCAGGPLTNLLSGRQIAPEVLIDWSVQIACGMHYLHEVAPVPLVHRDLKSSNVLIKEAVCTFHPDHNGPESDGCAGTPMSKLTLKISDFGLAREAYRTTRASVGGTYAWMAPEVIKASTFSPASDVYSFGVLLWELLTGDTPFRGMEPLAVAYGVASSNLALHIPKTCPDELRGLMEACWRTAPHERPSFSSLYADLKELQVSPELSALDDRSFHSLQADWRAEIESLLAETKEKESRLRSQEVQLQRSKEEQELKAREQLIREQQQEIRDREQELRERELKERELEIVHRELQITLSQLADAPLPPKPAERRNKSAIHRLFRRTPTQARGPISDPSHFRHNISVANVPSGSRASSESPPVSPRFPSTTKLPGGLLVMHRCKRFQAAFTACSQTDFSSLSLARSPDVLISVPLQAHPKKLQTRTEVFCRLFYFCTPCATS